MPDGRQRERLVARVAQMRRAGAARVATETGSEYPATLGALEARIVALEAMVQGLQDSVHRETTRQSRQIAELEARMEPSTLAVALSRDARQRGL
ncbi:MAG: hypothetical protein ACR2OB_11690 [Solirubrobacteraceae bacterium]